MEKSLIQIFSSTIVVLALTACAKPIVLVAKPGEAIDEAEVRLYYAQYPQCEFETVGYLEITGGHYSKASLFNTMKEQAASVGADGVYVIEAYRLDIMEYMGTARAIRCLNA